MSEPSDVAHVARQPNTLVMRLGIMLWLMSWFPIAEVFGWSGYARLATWAVQIVIGLIGLAFAGREFAHIVKQVGWKHTPRFVGVALWRGQVPPTGEAPPPAPPFALVDAPASRQPPSRRRR